MKVAIYGFAAKPPPGAFDASWEVWGLNGGHLVPGLHWQDGTFRADRWFQIHPPEACDRSELDWLDCLEHGQVPAVPTYIRGEDAVAWHAAYPQAAAKGLLVPYPLEEVQVELDYGWLANTFCLEIALALHLEATDIALVGVECTAYGRELAVERTAVAYWMGVANALGVNVHVLEGSTMAPYPEIYGLEYFKEARKAAEITERVLAPRDDLDAVNLDTVAAVDAAEDKARCAPSQQ